MRSALLFFFLLLPLSCLSFDTVQAAATEKAQGGPLQRLISQFDALDKDPVRGSRRDLWMALEDKFSAIATKNKGNAGAQAAFYHARSRQELGRRSYLPSDHREAAARFSAVAQQFPKHAVASESLYRQAHILVHRLSEQKEAQAVLEKLIKNYPKATERQEAEKLLAESKEKLIAEKQKAALKPAEPTVAAKNAAKGSSVTLKNISWQGKDQRAIITLELDAKVDYAHNFLPPDPANKTPGRLYLDIAGAFPSGAIKQGLAPKYLVVSRIRTGRTNSGTRVTLECDGLQCYAVSTPKGSPQTIQIEVSRKEDIKGGITVAGGARGGKRPASEPESVMEQLGLTVQTIMIDAGHGGNDPGAQAGGIVEKKFTLAMAKRVGALLQKEGFTVLYTRISDKYISLQDRPDMANKKKADLFISIHINANSKPTVHGLETYYLDEAKSQDAATVAARENAVSVKNISDLQFILTDLMLSSKLKESHHLAGCVHKGILEKLRGARLSASDNGVRSAPFYVLMGARMPAILVEFGYITNKQDAENLKAEDFLQHQAEGLVRGVLQYKRELAKAVPTPRKP